MITGVRAELEDLDVDEEDDGNLGTEEGGGFVPLREDAVQCFKQHSGEIVL